MNPHIRLAPALTAALLLFLSQPVAAAIVIEFQGIEGELQSAARDSLDLAQYVNRETSASQVHRLFAQAPDQIRQALEPYGYYHVHVDADLQPGSQPGDYRAVFRVEPGEPVIVRKVRIDVGDAASLPAVRTALNAFRPAIGEHLNHGEYEASRSNIAAALQANGYFDARMLRHRVEVSLAANSADVDLAWDPGRRYRFGDVHFTKTQFDEAFLARYVTWKPDAFYSNEDLSTFQQRLVDADYFSVVSIQPLPGQTHDGRVPIEALLIPAKRTIYRAAAYVSTDTGAGGRLGIERRWLNRRGHKIGADLEYSQRLEEYSAYYRIPRPGVKNRNYSFAGGYRDEQTDSSQSRNLRIAATEVLDDWYGYTRSLGLQYLNGDFDIADERRDSRLLFAEAMLTRRRVDNILLPRHGLSVTYDMRFAGESVLSNTSFVQLSAAAKWILPALRDSRVIMRAAVGAMTVDDFDALPPELRFFAGGDRSIRGFDYQQIGATNSTGGVIGGKYLTVASVEYEHYFLPKWGAAVFVDAGDAYISDFNLNVGAGIGLRWKSPVGIVRLDIAMPVVTDLEKSVRFHVVIGPDL